MYSKNNSSDLIVTEGFIETITFPVPLFFQPSFVYRKGKQHLVSYQLQHPSRKVTAWAHFSLSQPEHAVSLPASPFGSIFCNEQCELEDIVYFITSIKTSLVEKNCSSILIKHYPACYGTHSHDLVKKALLDSGFEISCTELNQYLLLKEENKKKVFDHSKVHLIKKCQEAGFTVSISSSFDADVWFDIITRARILRGHPLTIDLEGLRTLSDGNEDRYHFFEVKDNKKIIACAIGVRVSETVMYYYLAADEEEYRAYSPMTFLLDRLYSFAMETNTELLDMGISSHHGVVNEGLRWFKKSFGSSEEPKYVFKWSVNSGQSSVI